MTAIHKFPTICSKKWSHDRKWYWKIGVVENQPCVRYNEPIDRQTDRQPGEKNGGGGRK